MRNKLILSTVFLSLIIYVNEQFPKMHRKVPNWLWRHTCGCVGPESIEMAANVGSDISSSSGKIDSQSNTYTHVLR